MSDEADPTDPLAALAAQQEAEKPRRGRPPKDRTSIEPSVENEVPLLTEEEMEEARAEARRRYNAMAKKKAKDALIAEEMNRLARMDGQRTGNTDMDAIVPIHIDLPEFAPCLVINGEPFWHGHLYERPRHVVNSLREMCARAWNHQDDIDGKSISQKLSRRRMADPKQWMTKSAPRNDRFTMSANQVEQGEA